MVKHMVDTWWNTWWIVEVDVVVKFAPVVDFTGCPPGVPPGGMARSGPFSLYERTAFLSESGKAAFTARLLEWDKLAHVKVDRVKLVVGEEEVPTTLFKAQLPALGTAQHSSGNRGGYDDAKSERYENPRGLTVGDRAICPRPLLRATQSVPRACIFDLKLASASASA